ncbi:MAG TPA: VCBS repeat-containing protein, partial [Opitutaceae bacterium]|nr:VCBS repeat-containing protein [Opitutaceae bacterium]
NRVHDLGIPGAVDLATGSFGPQGAASAVVLTEDGTLHWLSHSGNDLQLQAVSKTQLPLKSVAGQTPRPQAIAVQAEKNAQANVLWVSTDTNALYSVSTDTLNGSIQEISAQPATHLTVGDLNGDSWPDLVLTQLNLVYPSATSSKPTPASVTVYWGSAQGPKKEAPLSLSIPNAQSTAIGDINGDGRPDLAVAVYQGKESLQAQSLLLLNPGGRGFSSTGLAVPTEGAEGVTITTLQPGTRPTAIFTHSQHRTLDDAVPLRLYWGVKGGFSRDTFVDIPNLSGYKSSAADLNSDGHVDMIVINGGDISEEASARAPDTGINIYWGGKTGDMKSPGPTQFAFARRDVLPEKHLGSINVADLNRDGYLDLILGAFESASRPDTELIIYYGTATGYNTERRVAIPVSGRSIGCLIADFNRDGELDIVVGAYTKNEVVVFWGKDGAHHADNKTILPYPAPIDLEAADFNGDGWLDLIVASYQDSVSQNHDTGSSIFWGGKDGWHQSRSQWLPGMTPLGLAVADLDGDGFLDLVSPHYHGELSREHLPSYIFWGSAAGFGAQRRTSLTVNSASEAIIADFDGDGRLDLAFAAHSVDPGHLLESPIFYNDGKRFENPKVQYLPAIGPHYMWVQDIGNIAHRRNEEHFDSRVFSWDERLRSGRIEVDAQTPFKSRVTVQIRTANQADGLTQAPWRDVARNTFNLQAEDRFLQYRLLLQSANGDAYPIVRKVEVSIK